MYRSLILAVVMIDFAGARAAEIPKYPIEQRCARFADYAAGGAVQNRVAIAKRCILDQQDAYDRLKDDWKMVSPTDRAQCLRMTGEEANYRSLGNCIGGLAARRAEEKRMRSGEAFHY